MIGEKELTFNSIRKNKQIISYYYKIDQDERIEGTAKHGLNHVLSVTNRLENTLKQLNKHSEYIEAAKIAGLLHDIGCIEGKKGHALRSYKMAKEFFEREKIDFLYIDETLNAIKDHSSGFDSQSVMTLTLVLCDKLDLTRERLAREGYETLGIRQLQFISAIHTEIKNGILYINFQAEHELDFEELMSFDFFDKVFKAIDTFCKHQNLSAEVKMNDQVFNGRME